MGLAGDERRGLSDLFGELGPDAPTLCTGWRTRDLAAHLVLRERRIDAAPGIAVSALQGHTRRVQDQYAARPWDELVALVRTGPPVFSLFAVPAIGELVNSTEYFVHHEDVRRAQPDWRPRPAEPARDDALWRALGRVARLTYRRSPVGVRMRRPDGQTVLAKRGPSPVTIQGEVGDLLLHAFGRSAVQVSFEGDGSAVSAVQNLDRRM
jgi:uncharacterized protein (TIGR03085 family)